MLTIGNTVGKQTDTVKLSATKQENKAALTKTLQKDVLSLSFSGKTRTFKVIRTHFKPFVVKPDKLQVVISITPDEILDELKLGSGRKIIAGRAEPEKFTGNYTFTINLNDRIEKEGAQINFIEDAANHTYTMVYAKKLTAYIAGKGEQITPEIKAGHDFVIVRDK